MSYERRRSPNQPPSFFFGAGLMGDVYFCLFRLCALHCRGFVAAWALVFGQTVRGRAAKTNPEEPGEVYNFYMFLWKIFYVSYLFLPLAR